MREISKVQNVRRMKSFKTGLRVQDYEKRTHKGKEVNRGA